MRRPLVRGYARRGGVGDAVKQAKPATGYQTRRCACGQSVRVAPGEEPICDACDRRRYEDDMAALAASEAAFWAEYTGGNEQ